MDTAYTGGGAPRAPTAERTHLERAHEELCTALTTIRSNVELARAHRRRIMTPSPTEDELDQDLAEIERGVERLAVLARTMRAWHDE